MMFDLTTGTAWTSVAFFPVLGALVLVASGAILASVRAGRQGRSESRYRARSIAAIFVVLAVAWPILAVLLTPIGAD
jgi:hypothetical protein